METFTHLFVYSFLFSLLRTSIAPETITPSQSIRDDGGTLVSSGGSFQLGFFSPGNSKSRYVGIWYMISPEIVVWVANRDAPLNDYSGILIVTGDGVLVLRNSTKGIVWSSNTSRTTANPVVQLLDTGNLVVKDRNENFLWQSFDYPCDTLLPEMKLGWNFVTGQGRFLTSWKSTEDPAQGEFSLRIDPRGIPQLVTMKGDSIKARGGSWNGFSFTGSQGLRPNPVYEYEFVWNEKEVYYEYKLLKASVFSRFVVNPSGISHRFNWVDRTHSWELYSTTLAEECDNYALCGANATCNSNKSPVCACLEGFLPKSQTDWDVANWAAGCARRTPLECNDTHGFQKHTRVKLPDTSSSWFNKTLTLKECEGLCLKNCSCTAYAPLDVREGGSSCVLWSGSLVDIKEYPEGGLYGQDLYIKMAISELDQANNKLLDWQKRINIIRGVAKGILYLHEDSRLRIIHRDLKASNILLDNNMNPKISDFGLARLFGGDQIDSETNRIIGTYGYMSPEYAMDGRYSVKSDVFSFGVLVLETLSGKKNRGFCHPDHQHNLLGHAWKLWIEGRPIELIDELEGDSCTISNVLRQVHVGLLCVQQKPEDRPNMSSVVQMLSSESSLPKPRQPGFFTDSVEPDPSSSKHETCSANEITVTLLEAR